MKKTVIQDKLIRILKKTIILFNVDKTLAMLMIKYPSASRFILFRPWCTDYPLDLYRECVRDGIRYKLMMNDYQDWCVFFGEKSDSSNKILEFVVENSIIFDIGGNIGQTALPIGKKLGSRGIVFTFEPNRKTYRRLLANVALNQKITAVSTYDLAISSEKRRLYIFNDSLTSSGSTKCVEITSERYDSSLDTVYSTTVDDFVRENNISKVDLIKIDVEGYEEKVIRGSLGVISKFRPIIIFEFNKHLISAAGLDPTWTLNKLSGLNYDFFVLDSKKKIGPKDLDQHIDVLAISSDKSHIV